MIEGWTLWMAGSKSWHTVIYEKKSLLHVEREDSNLDMPSWK
jgi:hypothetical protein